MQATIVKNVIIFLNTQLAIQWLEQVISWSYSSLKVQYDPMKIFIKNRNAKKRPISQQNNPIHQATFETAELNHFYG